VIYFVTGNAGKFREVKLILPDIEQLGLDLEEIQSLDPRAVIEHKLSQVAASKKGQFVVEDTSLSLTCLGGLPGTLIKWFEKSIGVEGIAEVALKYEDHSAIARTTIGYLNAHGQVHYFTGEQHGQIVAPRGTQNIFGWNTIFVPAGFDVTFAEMSLAEKNKTSFRAIAARKLKTHLDSEA
jgi:inosine triphosphate pyrophosphatase